MAGLHVSLSFLVLAGLMNLGLLSASENGNNYLREACSVTRYRDLCIHSLASFSHTAKRSPSRWARAGVSVTIGEAKHVAQYLVKLRKQGRMRGRNGAALSDCIECFQDAIDNLLNSLGMLRKLSSKAFDRQMSDVSTWMSAVLTDEDTCLDGFDGSKGKRAKLIRNRVQNVTYITSNALALVNKLATAGAGSLNIP